MDTLWTVAIPRAFDTEIIPTMDTSKIPWTLEIWRQWLHQPYHLSNVETASVDSLNWLWTLRNFVNPITASILRKFNGVLLGLFSVCNHGPIYFRTVCPRKKKLIKRQGTMGTGGGPKTGNVACFGFTVLFIMRYGEEQVRETLRPLKRISDNISTNLMTSVHRNLKKIPYAWVDN